MKNIITLSLLGLLLTSCGPKTSGVEFSERSIAGLSEEVTFAQLKSKILSPHCLGCHGDVSTEKGLSKWVVPGAPEKSSLFTEAESGNMPKNAPVLSTADLEVIRNYIETVAANAPAPTPSPTPAPVPQPSPGPAPTPTPTYITYSEVKSRILYPYGCTRCHSVGTEASLARWINVSSPSQSSFYTSVKSGSMPQGGADLTSEDKAFVLQYVKDYAARH